MSLWAFGAAVQIFCLVNVIHLHAPWPAVCTVASFAGLCVVLACKKGRR